MRENSTKFRFKIMPIKCLLFILCGIFPLLLQVGAADEVQKKIYPTIVWSELGGDAVLPCDVSTPVNDKINMVLWFKDTAGIPIYSYDARGVDVSNGVHMAISDVEKRCLFTLSTATGGSLKLFKITEADRGLYKCRVDFLNSPTQHHKIHLEFVELPSIPVITTDSGNELSYSAGPYHEEETLDLSCTVEGGKPTPVVTWWMNDQQLHGIVKESDSRIINHLVVASIPRNFNEKSLICQANVDGVSKPLKKIVHLDVYVRPLAVSMLNGNNILKDGESFSFLCECFGSNPPAIITWLLDGEDIRSSAITAMHNKNKTASKLTIRADSTFNGKALFCRCENVEFPLYHLEDKKILQVHYRPVANIILRSAYNFNKVKEGDNVTLECSVSANPPATAITWYHNGRMVEKGGNRTTYNLKNISLHWQGEYSCEATNKEGRSKSQSLMVNVLHVPFCQHGFENQYVMATVRETIILQCEVEPGLMNQHMQFFWTINNTMKITSIQDHHVESAGKISILKYTPETEDDFGTLACWAQNDIGPQKNPCYFHLTLANKPERPRNCIANNTSDVLQVSCEPGFDGGLKQYFVLEIRTATANYTVREDIPNEIFDQLSDEAIPIGIENRISKPLYKFQKENPIFDIFSLENGTPYILMLYAVNLKGKSEPVILVQGMNSSKPVKTASVSSEHSAVHDIVSLPSIYVTIITSALLIVSLAVITAVIVACRNHNNPRRPNVNNELNNIRIVYSDVHSKRTSNYEAEF